MNHQFSRRYSDGGSLIRVVSPSSSMRHASSIDQDSAAAQAMPVSTATICRSGISSNTPAQIIDSICIAIVLPFQTCISR